jgi:hypothetical protein
MYAAMPQLGPVVRSASAALAGLSTSLLELLIDYHNSTQSQDAQQQLAALAAGCNSKPPEGRLQQQQQQQQQQHHHEAGEQQQQQQQWEQQEPLSTQQREQQRQDSDEQQRHQAGASLSASERGGRARAAARLHLHYGMLTRNYRSHASLLELPSRLFYKQVGQKGDHLEHLPAQAGRCCDVPPCVILDLLQV